MIPHGHAPGPLTLELGNATGVARHPATVTVTPIVVSPTGAADGRGTFSSPMRLCGNNFTFARHGDLVLLRSGTHECDESVGAFSGVTFRG